MIVGPCRPSKASGKPCSLADSIKLMTHGFQFSQVTGHLCLFLKTQRCVQSQHEPKVHLPGSSN